MIIGQQNADLVVGTGDVLPFDPAFLGDFRG
jgi:fructose-specific component phosphotransferase system IIB-like protein